MEPGLRDREYAVEAVADGLWEELQWSPVLETGNTRPQHVACWACVRAAMEPGLRDREYMPVSWSRSRIWSRLQWSPVLETGNTTAAWLYGEVHQLAAMEPGLRDREYGRCDAVPCTPRGCCNGARS